MANMSYCRFRNTLSDLAECKDAFEEAVLNDSEDDKLSRDEANAFNEMIGLMMEFMEIIEENSQIEVEDIHNMTSLKEAFPNLIN